MLLISRLILVLLFMIYLLIMSILRFSLQPRHPKHVACVARNFSRLARLMGVKLIVRKPADLNDGGPYVFVGNHQNNFEQNFSTIYIHNSNDEEEEEQTDSLKAKYNANGVNTYLSKQQDYTDSDTEKKVHISQSNI